MFVETPSPSSSFYGGTTFQLSPYPECEENMPKVEYSDAVKSKCDELGPTGTWDGDQETFYDAWWDDASMAEWWDAWMNEWMWDDADGDDETWNWDETWDWLWDLSLGDNWDDSWWETFEEHAFKDEPEVLEVASATATVPCVSQPNVHPTSSGMIPKKIPQFVQILLERHLTTREQIWDFLQPKGEVLDQLVKEAFYHPMLEAFKDHTIETFQLAGEWQFGDPQGDILEDCTDFLHYLVCQPAKDLSLCLASGGDNSNSEDKPLLLLGGVQVYSDVWKDPRRL